VEYKIQSAFHNGGGGSVITGDRRDVETRDSRSSADAEGVALENRNTRCCDGRYQNEACCSRVFPEIISDPLIFLTYFVHRRYKTRC